MSVAATMVHCIINTNAAHTDSCLFSPTFLLNDKKCQEATVRPQRQCHLMQDKRWQRAQRASSGTSLVGYSSAGLHLLILALDLLEKVEDNLTNSILVHVEMQPLQPHPPPPNKPILTCRVTEPPPPSLVPVHRRSGGIHTILSPGMISCTELAARWPWHEEPSLQDSAWLRKLGIHSNKKTRENSESSKQRR